MWIEFIIMCRFILSLSEFLVLFFQVEKEVLILTVELLCAYMYEGIHLLKYKIKGTNIY
jgi:hypothetical protein